MNKNKVIKKPLKYETVPVKSYLKTPGRKQSSKVAEKIVAYLAQALRPVYMSWVIQGLILSLMVFLGVFYMLEPLGEPIALLMSIIFLFMSLDRIWRHGKIK
jgi:hypothetical protein